MKFKFAGDQDCPEWILQEMAVVSKLSSVRVRLLAKILIQNMLAPALNPLNYDKLQHYTTSTRTTFTEDEVKAIMNTLYFVLYNATRFDVTGDVLYPELEQLGLPSDCARSLTKTFLTYQDELRKVLSSQTLKLNTLQNLEWRVNYIIDSSIPQAAGEPRVETRLILTIDKNHTIAPNVAQQKPEVLMFDASLQSIDILLNELKECRNIMQQVAKQ